MSDALGIADRLAKLEHDWPKSSRRFYRDQRYAMLDAERELRYLAAKYAALESDHATHLAAWQRNNEALAARIAELEAQLARERPETLR